MWVGGCARRRRTNSLPVYAQAEMCGLGCLSEREKGSCEGRRARIRNVDLGRTIMDQSESSFAF